MPTDVTNYQCPACTGPLHFSGESGKLECDYCGSSYEVAQIEALYAEKNAQAAAAPAETGTWDAAGMKESWGLGGEGMKSYICPSCGAELLCDASTAATSCPYCGNPTVVRGSLQAH